MQRADEGTSTAPQKHHLLGTAQRSVLKIARPCIRSRVKPRDQRDSEVPTSAGFSNSCLPSARIGHAADPAPEAIQRPPQPQRVRRRSCTFTTLTLGPGRSISCLRLVWAARESIECHRWCKQLLVLIAHGQYTEPCIALVPSM